MYKVPHFHVSCPLFVELTLEVVEEVFKCKWKAYQNCSKVYFVSEKIIVQIKKNLLKFNNKFGKKNRGCFIFKEIFFYSCHASN